MSKIIKCKTCGADMASNAKACPACGAKNKKPIYARVWFWLLVVVVAIIVIAVSTNSGSKSSAPAASSTTAVTSTETSAASAEAQTTEPEPAPEITYNHYTFAELADELEANALRAEQNHQDEYVEVEGYLYIIDSDGKYFTLNNGKDDYNYFLKDIRCNIKSDEQKAQIASCDVGAKLIVRGQITEIGEVLSYRMNVNSIEIPQ